MNFLISTLLFGISIMLMIGIAQLINNVVSFRTVRQPVRAKEHNFRW